MIFKLEIMTLIAFLIVCKTACNNIYSTKFVSTSILCHTFSGVVGTCLEIVKNFWNCHTLMNQTYVLLS